MYFNFNSSYKNNKNGTHKHLITLFLISARFVAVAIAIAIAIVAVWF